MARDGPHVFGGTLNRSSTLRYRIQAPPPPLKLFCLEILGPSCKFGEKLGKFMKHAAHSGTSRFKLARFVAKMLQGFASAAKGGGRICGSRWSASTADPKVLRDRIETLLLPAGPQAEAPKCSLFSGSRCNLAPLQWHAGMAASTASIGCRNSRWAGVTES